MVLVCMTDGSGRWMVTGGNRNTDDASAAIAAARELYEEACGLDGDAAKDAGSLLLQSTAAAGNWSGPYGRRPPDRPHESFLLVTDGVSFPSVDNLVSAFQPKAECSYITLVPITGVDGSASSVTSFEGTTLQLRYPLGHERITKLQQIVHNNSPTRMGARTTTRSADSDRAEPTARSRPPRPRGGLRMDAPAEEAEARRRRLVRFSTPTAAEAEAGRFDFAHRLPSEPRSETLHDAVDTALEVRDAAAPTAAEPLSQDAQHASTPTVSGEDDETQTYATQ